MKLHFDDVRLPNVDQVTTQEHLTWCESKNHSERDWNEEMNQPTSSCLTVKSTDSNYMQAPLQTTGAIEHCSATNRFIKTTSKEADPCATLYCDTAMVRSTSDDFLRSKLSPIYGQRRTHNLIININCLT